MKERRKTETTLLENCLAVAHFARSQQRDKNRDVNYCTVLLFYSPGAVWLRRPLLDNAWPSN